MFSSPLPTSETVHFAELSLGRQLFCKHSLIRFLLTIFKVRVVVVDLKHGVHVKLWTSHR